MWTGIAQGEFDVTIAAWLPTTHAPYYEQLWTQIENLGPAMHGAKIGLVVPTYVTINSIEELNAERSRFGGRIVGIDPGAGIMQRTEEAIEAYGLDFMLVDGSDAAMTAALRSAIRRNQWIVVTGWTPHWKFAEYDLKYLEDPKGVYGGSEEITKIVRKGLHEDAPDAYKLLQRFYWTPEQMAEVLVAILEGADPPMRRGSGLRPTKTSCAAGCRKQERRTRLQPQTRTVCGCFGPVCGPSDAATCPRPSEPEFGRIDNLDLYIILQNIQAVGVVCGR